MYSIDQSKKPQQISMFLAKPNRTIIGKINIATGITQKIKFGQVNELTLSIPYETTINSQLIRNPIVDLVREKFLIKVVFGTTEEWYVINKKTKSMNEYDSITLECFSLAYNLTHKKIIDYKVDSYTCFQVLNDCLADTNWTIGYINQNFNTTWRSFDVSSKTKLDFIQEICDTFQGIATFDTVNRTVSIWKEDELSVYKGFWISYGKYLETLDDTISIDDVVTRLVVTDNDSASIRSANPTGQNYIDDFSYFLYPFYRNDNREVITSSYFMSDDLCHAILDYNELVNKNADVFANLLSTKKNLQTQMTTLTNDMQTLKDDLQSILDDIEINKQDELPTSDLIKQRDSKQSLIDSKQNEINTLQKTIDNNTSDINNLNELLKTENNFKGDLLNELNDYIQVQEWQDQNQVNDLDYFNAAAEQLNKVSSPPINLTLSIVNFFEMVEESHNWDRLSIGDIIRVKHSKLGIDVKTKITEIDFNYDDGTIQLTISNTKAPETIQQKIKNAFYTINKLHTDYNKRKVNWESVATNFNTANDRIKGSPRKPVAANISHKQNDDGSVSLTLNWTFPSYDKTKSDIDNIDGFIISLYSSSTNEKYWFGSNYAKEQEIPVISDKRTYTFTSVPANLYYSVGIKSYRNVDDDIAKAGVLFSGVATFPQYLPNPNVTVNVNGRVNGSMHTVSEMEPPNPSVYDIWTDTTTNQQKVYDGTTWNATSAGNATTVGGLIPQVTSEPNTIPVRDSNAVIQGSISGDAATLGGKSASAFPQLDVDGNVPLVNLTNVTSTIPKIDMGSYTGDGTVSKQINLGYQPRLVRVYTTGSTDFSSYIPSTSGGFLMKNNSTTFYFEGVGTNNNTLSPIYGMITANGFSTGNTATAYINKLNTVYYWEAIK